MCGPANSETGDKKAGFTLIEVLVAISVVAISLTSIGMLTGTTTRGVRSLEQHVALVETARTVVASLASRTQLSPNKLDGELYGNRWRLSVSPFVSDAIAPVPGSLWIPEIITIRIQSPSGAVLGLKTVRLQRRRE